MLKRIRGAQFENSTQELMGPCMVTNIALCRWSYYAYCAFLLPFFLLASPAFSYNLPVAVHQALRQAGVPESAVGVYYHEIGSAQPLLQHNSGTVMNPASVMKLVTTYAGLELLGPAYTWKTELYVDGLRDGDTLNGDFIIKGYGDPKLNLENFWLLTRRLRQTGLREITGGLILDTSHFQLLDGNPAEFDGKPHRAYNVLPEALLVNYRTVSLRLIPKPESGNVRVVVDPLPASLDLKNGLALPIEHAAIGAMHCLRTFALNGEWVAYRSLSTALIPPIAEKKPYISAFMTPSFYLQVCSSSYGKNRGVCFGARYDRHRS